MKITSLVKKIPLINRRRISSFKVVISINLSIFFVKKSSFNETSRENDTLLIAIYIVVINKYKSFHINIKNVIVFTSLKMKKIYDTRYQFIFFKIKNLVNLRLHKNYKVFIITSKKIRL